MNLDAFEGLDDLMAFAESEREKSRAETVPIYSRGSDFRVAYVVLTPDPSTAPVRTMLQDEDVIYVHGRSPSFNESRWFNEGIATALRADAEWIVLMSDDLWEITPVKSLRTQLDKIDNHDTDVVWINPAPSYYHSYRAYLARKHPLESVMGKGHIRLAGLCKKFQIETVIASEKPIRKPFHYWAFNKLFPRPYVGPSFRMTSDFCILSSEWCRKQGEEVLNELFKGWEDMDLSMRLRDARSKEIDFRMGSEIGGTLGVGMDKALMEVYNLAVFDELLRRGKYSL